MWFSKKKREVCKKCNSYTPGIIETDNELTLCGELFHEDLIKYLDKLYETDSTNNKR